MNTKKNLVTACIAVPILDNNSTMLTLVAQLHNHNPADNIVIYNILLIDLLNIQ